MAGKLAIRCAHRLNNNLQKVYSRNEKRGQNRMKIEMLRTYCFYRFSSRCTQRCVAIRRKMATRDAGMRIE
ncbi:hypothetical protein KCP74_14730 [Salmonella enterica subsp. enterica]|nr:hypothetical protein KCP74_14730 [Salmonella enterica subsp. enterica]